ncbi:MAG: hypothetical protein AAF151_08925 [Cyanobacteria bacterium J06656_5]
MTSTIFRQGLNRLRCETDSSSLCLAVRSQKTDGPVTGILPGYSMGYGLKIDVKKLKLLKR